MSESEKQMSRAKLSPKETEVIRLAARGAVDKEIADMLKISTGTVKVHWDRIRLKLGAKTRTEAAVKWFTVPQMGDTKKPTAATSANVRK